MFRMHPDAYSFSKLRIVIMIIFHPQIGRKITILQLGPEKLYCYGKKRMYYYFLRPDLHSGVIIQVMIVTITMIVTKTVMITISIIKREIGGKLWGSQMTLLPPHWPLGQLSRDMIGEKLFAKLMKS